jgi:hypothetical protein
LTIEITFELKIGCEIANKTHDYASFERMRLLSSIIANKQEKGYWENYSILGENFRIEILPLGH